MEATTALATAPRAPLYSPVSPVRRLVASAGLIGSAAIWSTEAHLHLDTVAAVYAPLAVALIAIHVDRILPQVYVRAALWAELAFSALGAGLSGQKVLGGVALASGIALLALGSAPFLTETVKRQFSPIGFRRMFVLACVVLLVASYFLTALGYEWLTSSWFHHRRLGVTSLFETFLILASVFGVLRMRAWGVLAALAATLVGGAVALIAGLPDTGHILGIGGDGQAVRFVFGLGAACAFLMVSPIVVSWFFPARVRAEGEKPRAAWMHAALVVVTVGAAVVGVVAGGLHH